MANRPHCIAVLLCLSLAGCGYVMPGSYATDHRVQRCARPSGEGPVYRIRPAHKDTKITLSPALIAGAAGLESVEFRDLISGRIVKVYQDETDSYVCLPEEEPDSEWVSDLIPYTARPGGR